MILPSNAHNFEKLAQEVSTGFFTNGDSLTEGVSKVASRENLNPEEIRRLVERTNVTTTVQMLKVSTDKQVEFSLADYDSVIRDTHSSLSPSAPSADSVDSSIPSHFPDITGNHADSITFVTAEKTASEKKENLSRKIFKGRQMIEELTQKKLACEIAVVQGIDFLVGEFEQYNGPDFHKFANEAFSMDGAVAMPIIATLSDMLKAPVELEKVASFVDDSDRLLKKYSEIKQALIGTVTAQKSINKLAEEQDTLWQQISKAGLADEQRNKTKCEDKGSDQS